MRALVISVVIFALLCAVIAANLAYINDVTEELRYKAARLDIKDERALDLIAEIEDKWKKSEAIFSLSVSYKELDFFGETLISLREAYKVGEKFEFERHKALLIDAIDGMSRLERFSIINIF